jgi:Glycosyltransferase 61
VTTAREAWLVRVRAALGRVFRPWFAPRHGRFFVTRRTVTSFLSAAANAGPAPKGYALVSVDDVAESVPGAQVHRPEPGYPVLELPDGVVFGPKGHVGDGSGRVIDAFSVGGTAMARRVLRQSALAARGEVAEVPGITASLCQDSFGNYCHWLIQGFVRLEMLDRTVSMRGVDRFLVPPDPPAFLIEALAHFGIGRARVVEVPDAPWVFRCEHLLAAGLPPTPEGAPRWVLDDLRARYGEPAAPEAPRRIYLGRGETSRRRVLNEAAVLAALIGRGFVAITMDGRTIAQQAAMMAAVECIVAPHGAALTNLVFAPPAATVVELAAKNYALTMFRDLAATMGLRYVAIDGLEPQVPTWLVRPRVIDADIIVDVDTLTGTLDDLGFR